MGRKVCVVAKIGTRPRAASARVTSRTMRGRLVERPRYVRMRESREGRELPGTTTAARERAAESSLRTAEKTSPLMREREAKAASTLFGPNPTASQSSSQASRWEVIGRFSAPRALVEDREHGLGEVAAVDAVPGAGEGDGERVRRAPHVEDLLALFEREQIQEPALVITGCVACERRGPLVPIGLRVAVDCARLFSVRGWHHAMPSLSYREAWQHRLANVRIVLQF